MPKRKKILNILRSKSCFNGKFSPKAFGKAEKVPSADWIQGSEATKESIRDDESYFTHKTNDIPMTKTVSMRVFGIDVYIDEGGLV